MLAALPILVVLALMIGLRLSAARAGSAGLATAVIVALSEFGLGTTLMPQWGRFGSVGGAMAEAGFIALTVLWIIFPALCIHEMQMRTGSMDVLQKAMGRITGDPRIMALLIAWFFVLFVEGAAGFGTPVALAAPFLVSAGFGKVAAVSIALIGHAVGVSFGAVGTPVLPQLAVTGLSGLELAGATAAYHALLGWMMPLVVMLFATRALGGETRMAPLWGWALFAAVCFLLPFYLLARYVGPELPTLGGALLGALLFVGVLKFRSASPAAPRAPGAGASEVLMASAPYLLLIVLVLATRLLPALKAPLSSVALAWSLGPFGASMQILYHPGTMLLASFILAALLTHVPIAALASIMASVAKRLLPVCAALLAMLGLSRVMVHAGMIDGLAASASGVGSLWPLLAPAIGALGTFVTGSATASNILLTEFQVATARQLGLSVLGLSAAQGFGAAVGNIICPHNIVAASATVNLVGREAEVLRRTVVVTLVYCALGGLAALLLFA